jgi:hypothetical protein
MAQTDLVTIRFTLKHATLPGDASDKLGRWQPKHATNLLFRVSTGPNMLLMLLRVAGK